MSAWFLALRVAEQVDQLLQHVPRAVQKVEERLTRYERGRQITAHMPNADTLLTIAAQVLLGVLLGGFGLALASPLTAAAIVLVKMLYIEDVLGDQGEMPGTRSEEQLGS